MIKIFVLEISFFFLSKFPARVCLIFVVKSQGFDSKKIVLCSKHVSVVYAKK